MTDIKCEGCLILIEDTYIESSLKNNREHFLCSWCIDRWKKLESRYGKVTWEQFRFAKGLNRRE